MSHTAFHGRFLPLQQRKTLEETPDASYSRSWPAVEQRLQQALLRGARTYDVGADAVDRGVEVVQTDVYAVEGVAADDLLWPARACRRS